MHATLAILLAVAAGGQTPDNIDPELIPPPPGYGAPPVEGGPHTHRHTPHGHAVTIGRPAQFAYPTGHIYPDVAPEGIYGPRPCTGWMYPNGICGHKCVDEPHSWGNWWIPPGNMIPHYHYFSGEHGYYYFKPYNVTRVAMQQAFAASYGGDPRHPYSRDVFDRVYRIYDKRHGFDKDAEAPPLPESDEFGEGVVPPREGDEFDLSQP